MADAETLTHAFMRAHPVEAARVLEAVPPAEAAALFARVPARLGAAVLGAMLPGLSARALEPLDDGTALALAGGLATQPLVALLRHVPEPRRGRLIAGLPTGAALASKLLLGFAEDTVGAWTDPDVVVLPGETRAADALARVRRSEAAVLRVFMTGPGQRLEGWVPIAALLRAPETAPLATLASRPNALLAAHAPLAGALAHPGWEGASALPVVEPGDRLVGVLTRDALTRALRRTARAAPSAGQGSLGGTLARGYWEALSGVVEAAATLLPPIGPVAGNRDEH